jgi:hypothetical protein
MGPASFIITPMAEAAADGEESLEGNGEVLDENALTGEYSEAFSPEEPAGDSMGRVLS